MNHTILKNENRTFFMFLSSLVFIGNHTIIKDCVMKTVTTVQENAGDIYADAQQINEDRKAAEEPFEDEAAEGETEFKETDEAEEAETEEAAE